MEKNSLVLGLKTKILIHEQEKEYIKCKCVNRPTYQLSVIRIFRFSSPSTTTTTKTVQWTPGMCCLIIDIIVIRPLGYSSCRHKQLRFVKGDERDDYDERDDSDE